MSNKKKSAIIRGIVISTLSLWSIQSFSVSSINDSTRNHKSLNLYVTGQYKTSISHFYDFSVKETDFDTKKLFGLKKDSTSIASDINTNTNFNIPYDVKFQNSTVSFGGAIGYISPKDLRLEIESSYEKFDVQNLENCVTDAHRYFALARSITSEKTPITPESNKYTVMRNDGLSIASVMVNGCYDFSLNTLEVLPYICIGVGGDFIEFFDAQHIKFAYQGKLGVNYSLSSNITLFAGGYHHRVMGNQFKNLNTQHIHELDSPKNTSAIATLNIEYFGGELGLRFIF